MDVLKVTKKDLKEIQEMEKEIFSDSWSLKSLESSLEQENSLFLCVKEKGAILGYVIFYVAADEGEIIRIAVKKDRRREGIGQRMLLKIEDYCEKKGINTLYLEVREGNASAFSFYLESGFINSGLRKDYYENPKEDAILMKRELGQ
ncbi:MAG TPA: ribosomal protein S18-alanine N-acetyltransferase [Candidatus Dorea intestinavium]|nr:ribosomal protein S18-alanine N-acetyltransferase [Candidatus Dorea intestinavium]